MAKRLREQVGTDTKALLNAVASGSPGADLGERVSRLRDLHWLADEVAPLEEARRRWPAAVIVIVTVGLLTVLLGSPRSIGVVVDATTSMVEFSLPRIARGGEFATVLSDLSLERIAMEGSIQVVPASAPVRSAQNAAMVAPEGGKVLRLQQAFVTNLDGKISPVVSVTSESPQQLRLCATGARLSFDLEVADASGAGSMIRTFQVHVVPPATKAGNVAVTPVCAVLATAAPATRLRLMGNLSIANLSVNGPAYRPAGLDDQADIFPSELKAAKVAFQDVPGTRQLIDEEQRLELAGFKGNLRRVHWIKDRLQVQGNGLVSDVSRSLGATKQSLMPSRLSILRAKHSDGWVAWGLLIYVLGIGLSLLKWYGVKT